MSTPSDVAREWFQKVWNERDEESIDRMLNPKAEIVGISASDATVLRGPAEFRVFRGAFLSAFPDLRVEITKVIEQDDWVAVRFTCEGTHSGEGLGVAPSGRRVHFFSMALGRVENGQWVEGWNMVDFPELNRQMGGEPRIGGPAASA